MATPRSRRRRSKRSTSRPIRRRRRTALHRVLRAPLLLIALVLEEPIVWLALASYALYRTGLPAPVFPR
jgi:hypothetical protein